MGVVVDFSRGKRVGMEGYGMNVQFEWRGWFLEHSLKHQSPQ